MQIKSLQAIAWLIGLSLTLVLLPVMAQEAATTFSTGSPYPDNADMSETLSIQGATALVVTVSGKTRESSDYITITDSNGNQAGRFYGNINQKFVVEGSSIDVRFTSDYNYNTGSVTVTIASLPESAQRPSVECNEITEPLSLNYGEHVTNCSIEPEIDLDLFSFVASAGDSIRISGSAPFRHRLEIWDPAGTQIVNTYSRIVNKPLTLAGTYIVAFSDWDANQTGKYDLQLEKIPPVLNLPYIHYNFPVTDFTYPATDVAFFSFLGGEKTTIRLMSSSHTTGFEPHLTILDPDGKVILDTTNRRVDKSLTLSGTYIIGVFDSDANKSGFFSISIYCLTANCPTKTAALFTTNPNQGEAPLTVALNASASKGNITDYAWSSSDGQTATDRNTSMTFDTHGTYTISLTVTDEAGETDTNNQIVEVLQPSQ